MVRAFTDVPALLFLTWSYTSPTRHPIYRHRRGVLDFCGYELIWENPNTVNQYPAFASTQHDWLIFPIEAGRTVWFYIWSLGGPTGNEVQSPVVRVIIPTQQVPFDCCLWCGIGAPASTPPIPPATINVSVTST